MHKLKIFPNKCKNPQYFKLSFVIFSLKFNIFSQQIFLIKYPYPSHFRQRGRHLGSVILRLPFQYLFGSKTNYTSWSWSKYGTIVLLVSIRFVSSMHVMFCFPSNVGNLIFYNFKAKVVKFGVMLTCLHQSFAEFCRNKNA